MLFWARSVWLQLQVMLRYVVQSAQPHVHHASQYVLHASQYALLCVYSQYAAQPAAYVAPLSEDLRMAETEAHGPTTAVAATKHTS